MTTGSDPILKYDDVLVTEKWELKFSADIPAIRGFLAKRGITETKTSNQGRRHYLLVKGLAGRVREARHEARKRWSLRLAGVVSH